MELPVRLSPWEFTAHVDLQYATLTCWVQPNAGGVGIVTARHAVSSGYVDLDDGTTQPVLWYAPRCLDAAVTDGPAGVNLTTLTIGAAAAQDAVDVRTKSGIQTRVVSNVGQSYGTVTGRIPHHFLLDQPLQPGDSGSLVRRQTGGNEALGLYLGRLDTNAGPRGLCQGLEQLDKLFHYAGHSAGFYEE